MSRLCAQNAVPLLETSVLCGQVAGWDVLRTFRDLKSDFGSSAKKAFVLRTEAAFAALAAWKACSEVAWAAWKAHSEAA